MPAGYRPFLASAAIAALAVLTVVSPARAEIDGHGPDAWRVTGVSRGDALNARMGPGTKYPVIETFAHDERDLQLITCVPFYTMAHFSRMSEAEIDALPPRWCLMRSADMTRAGWVAQRYLIGEGDEPVDTSQSSSQPAKGGDPVSEAQDVVRALYEAADPARAGGRNPLDPAYAGAYFSSEVVATLRAQPLQVDPVYGAQDFQGSVSAPEPDPDQPMFRGMITINVEIVNFGRPHTAVFRLRADPGQPGAPVRIFRIEHDGWSFP